MNVLSLKNVKKNFGENAVLNGVTMDVEEGSIFGFIGKNGAGKTTTMKSILGLLKFDSGEIKVCGENVKYGQTATNKNIGYLPDVPSFYNYMTPLEYLKLCGEITGMDKTKINKRSTELLKLVGLEVNKKRIGGFSRGMKQRLGIAQALLSEPKLLICDEPTSALDPVGRKEILEILSKIKNKTTVIFSTHVLTDVEHICDKVALLHDGKIVMTGTIDDVKKQYKKDIISVVFENEDDTIKFKNFLDENKINSTVNFNEISVKSSNLSEIEELIISLLYKNKMLPTKLEIINPTLEDLVLEAIK